MKKDTSPRFIIFTGPNGPYVIREDKDGQQDHVEIYERDGRYFDYDDNELLAGNTTEAPLGLFPKDFTSESNFGGQPMPFHSQLITVYPTFESIRNYNDRVRSYSDPADNILNDLMFDAITGVRLFGGAVAKAANAVGTAVKSGIRAAHPYAASLSKAALNSAKTASEVVLNSMKTAGRVGLDVGKTAGGKAINGMKTVGTTLLNRATQNGTISLGQAALNGAKTAGRFVYDNTIGIIPNTLKLAGNLLWNTGRSAHGAWGLGRAAYNTAIGAGKGAGRAVWSGIGLGAKKFGADVAGQVVRPGLQLGGAWLFNRGINKGADLISKGLTGNTVNENIGYRFDIDPSVAAWLNPLEYVGYNRGARWADNTGKRLVETAMRTTDASNPIPSIISGFKDMWGGDIGGKKRLLDIGDYILTGKKTGSKGYYNSFASYGSTKDPSTGEHVLNTYPEYYTGFDRWNEPPSLMKEGANDVIDAYLYGKTIDPRWGLKKVDTKDYGKFSQYGNFSKYVKLNYPLTRAQVYQVKAEPGTSYYGYAPFKLSSDDYGKKFFPSARKRDHKVVPEDYEVSPITVGRDGK